MAAMIASLVEDDLDAELLADASRRPAVKEPSFARTGKQVCELIVSAFRRLILRGDFGSLSVDRGVISPKRDRRVVVFEVEVEVGDEPGILRASLARLAADSYSAVKGEIELLPLPLVVYISAACQSMVAADEAVSGRWPLLIRQDQPIHFNQQSHSFSVASYTSYLGNGI